MADISSVSMVIALLLWPAGLLFLARPRLLRQFVPADVPEVSVIIPARNEAHNLPVLLNSLAKLSPVPREILVVNDGSTDDTASVASAGGARVIHVSQKPAGWNGKSFALHTGVQASQYGRLLFVDADTWLAPSTLAYLEAAWQQAPGLVSVQPYHTVHRLYEQCAALLNVLVLGGLASAGIADNKSKPRGAFGPLQYLAKEHYFKTGGYERIRGAALEDIPFGQGFLAQGLGLQALAGKGLVFFRMYPGGWREMLQGFSKSFARGAQAVPTHSMVFSILWIVGAIMAFTAACVFHTAPTLGIYLLYVVGMAWHFHWTGSFHKATALFYPLPLMFFMVVQVHSWWNTFIVKSSTWKGRRIDDKGEPPCP